MITIINKDNLSLMILEDNATIEVYDNYTSIDGINHIDINIENSKVIKDVIPPKDWNYFIYKYFEQNIKQPLKPFGWIKI